MKIIGIYLILMTAFKDYFEQIRLNDPLLYLALLLPLLNELLFKEKEAKWLKQVLQWKEQLT